MTPRQTAGETEASTDRRTPARRAFLLGGLLGGLAGGVGGAAAGRLTAPSPPPPTRIEELMPDGAKLSFAQYGEDLIAASLFDSINLPKPTYMDIGAFEPIASNNTYFFYLRGGRGLLVEPNPPYAEKLKVARPGDAVLAAGIGTGAAAEADYYVMTEAQKNTFDREQAERLDREGSCKIAKVVKMPLVDVNRAIAEHFGGAAPDFLSIDVEGLDLAVLKTLDFTRYRPKVICAETLVTATLKHNPALTELMAASGYEIRGMTYPNTCYMDKKLLKSK